MHSGGSNSSTPHKQHCGPYSAIVQTCHYAIHTLDSGVASQGHYEVPPYQNDTMRSAYHVRELDVYRLLQLRRPVDVALSHDWPRGIAHHGDKAQLFRAKTFLRREVRPCCSVDASCFPVGLQC